MSILLLHPDDGFAVCRKGQAWSLVVDLGRAPKSFYAEQSAAFGCPVSSIFDLAIEVDDIKDWRPLLKQGLNWVVDRYGIDWWDVMSSMLQPRLQDVRLAMRLAERIKGNREIWASRPSATAEAVRVLSGIPVHILQHRNTTRLNNFRRRGRALANLGFTQLRQVVYDKYDPHYRWRKKFADPPKQWSQPVVLLPTAYSNVTKTALAYARLLPEQKFLLLVARESAWVDAIPANIETAMLASFASGRCDPVELNHLENRWEKMQRVLQQAPEFQLAIQLGILKKGQPLRWGLEVRNAWLKVFESRPVIGCLSADDSNPYTRIPLLLAEKRGVPAVACHHGALDYRMACKNLRFSKYLAKGEMERDFLERVCGVEGKRIAVGAPETASPKEVAWSADAPWITFFSEPYETDSWRAEAIYREVLPPLCEAARTAGKTVVLKLHPFESARQRRKMVAQILPEEEKKLVIVTDAPMSREVLAQTWCAVTVESTAALECASIGIPAFLCGWLRNSYAGYVPQFLRFGVGQMLQSAGELSRIPELLSQSPSAAPGQPKSGEQQSGAISLDTLREVLCPSQLVPHGTTK
jgi:hypothetical protein